MAEHWTPVIEYPDGGTELELTLPMRYWRARKTTLGGMREAAAGGTNRAWRKIRTDYLLEVTFRLHEDEQPDFETFHEWILDNFSTPFVFTPDAGVPGTTFEVLLVSPAHGEDLAFVRGDFPSTVEVTLTLRREDGNPWDLAWYPD